jgi:hypothetical protein
MVRGDNILPVFVSKMKPAWAEVWHLWTVVIPRRSITGRLIFGKVWRRHDGRRWTYKKFNMRMAGRLRPGP